MGDPVLANILLGGAVVYYAPYDEAVPAQTVAAGTAWGGNWARIGFTKEPLAVLYEAEEADINVEEELTPVDRLIMAESATFETILAEATATYFGLATSYTPTVTAAGVGQVGKTVLNVGGDIIMAKYAVGFEAVFRNSAGVEFPSRCFVWRCTFKLNGALEFSKKSGDYAGIPIQIKALADTTKAIGSKLFRLEFITAAATS